jgi:Flp pilus assembly protein TadG
MTGPARMQTRNRSRNRRRGSASLELALVVPLFMAMICGVLEVSRLCSVSELLSNIARDGCRVAVANGQTSATATARITNLLSNAGITGSTVTISPTLVENSTFASQISVTITVPYSNVSWLQMTGWNWNTNVSANAIMSSEQNPPG